jgi:hypothetical protein
MKQPLLLLVVTWWRQDCGGINFSTTKIHIYKKLPGYLELFYFEERMVYFKYRLVKEFHLNFTQPV